MVQEIGICIFPHNSVTVYHGHKRAQKNQRNTHNASVRKQVNESLHISEETCEKEYQDCVYVEKLQGKPGHSKYSTQNMRKQT